jgi:small-conductance mechanosensitive channel
LIVGTRLHYAGAGMLEQWLHLVKQIPYLEALPYFVQGLLLPVAIWVLYGVLSRIAPFLVRRSSREGVRLLFRRTRFPVQMILAMIIVDSVVSGMGETHRELNVVPFFHTRVTPLVIVFGSALLIYRLIGTLFVALREQFDVNTPDNLKARQATTQIIVLERLVTVAIVVIAVAIALMTIPEVRRFGTSLLASAGVAGLVIGFAAQQSIANVLAGIQIAITQPLRIDDAVVIDGEWGWVEEITLTYVVVRIWDRRRLVVPISYLLQKPFQNWTRSSSSVIGTVIIHADYTVDVATLRLEQSRLLAVNPLWDGQVDVVQITDTTQETVVIRSLVSAENSSKAWDLRCELREKLIRWLQETQPGALPRKRMRIQGSVTQGVKARERAVDEAGSSPAIPRTVHPPVPDPDGGAERKPG